jgi:hypothetical protein
MTMAIPIDHMIHKKVLIPEQALGGGTHLSNPATVASAIQGRVYIDVVDATGGTSLAVFIEDSHNKVRWFVHSEMNLITAAGPYAESIENFGEFIRVRVEQTGTFAYSVVFQGKS